VACQGLQPDGANRRVVPVDVSLFGKREDLLRRVAGDWRIAWRKIVLDQNVLLAKNLTVFF
jgi:3-phenylpropionate/cinnamic acid dioxygenase small subunit